jgi:hypothetical protein
MPLVEGQTLRERLQSGVRMPIPEVARVLAESADALAYAHELGLVHRDIKPENVLIDRSGTVKVVDFGLARAAHVAETRRAPLLVTAAYVAPEIMTGGPATPATDVYSIGIVLYELLTGAVPFDGPNPSRVARLHVDHAVPSPATLLPQLPPPVCSMVVRATRRNPTARFRDADTLVSAMDGVLRRAGNTRHPRPVSRPRRLRRLALVTIALLLVGAAGWWMAADGADKGSPHPTAPISSQSPLLVFGLLDQGLQVHRLAQLLDQVELGLQVVDVLLLVGEDALEELRRGDVVDRAHVLDAAPQPIHRLDLDLHVAAEHLGDVLADAQGEELLVVGQSLEEQDAVGEDLGVPHLVQRLGAGVLGQLGVAPVVLHLGVQEVLVDGGQLGGQLLVQEFDDLLVASHGRLLVSLDHERVTRYGNGKTDKTSGNPKIGQAWLRFAVP